MVNLDLPAGPVPKRKITEKERLERITKMFEELNALPVGTDANNARQNTLEDIYLEVEEYNATKTIFPPSREQWAARQISMDADSKRS